MHKNINNKKKIIHVVGANPNGGGVFTYIKNIYKSIDNIIIYNYHDYQFFFKNLKSGDTVFFNVIKPSIPFLIMVFLRVPFRFNMVYCGHGLNYKNNVGLRRLIVYFFEVIMTFSVKSVIVLNKKDLNWFKTINKNSYCIPTSLSSSKHFNEYKKRKLDLNSLNWVSVGLVEKRKDPLMFIKIAKKIRTHFPNDSFTWIGDGPLLKEINTKELSRENIFFTGGISNSVVKKRLLNNDIFICTSKYEVLPISILEAVEAANIVITRNYPYADDILNRFSSSVIFTNIEEVLKIRSNNNLLKSLNINAIKERKLIESNYNKYINKIKKLLLA